MIPQPIEPELLSASKNTSEEPQRLIGKSAASGWPDLSGALSHYHAASIPMIKSHEEITKAGQDAIDAMTKTSAALTEGLKEISQHIMGLTQRNAKTHFESTRELFEVKTVKDLFELHSKWANHFLKTVTMEIAKLSELSIKVGNQTAEPIKAHLSQTFSKAGSKT